MLSFLKSNQIGAGWARLATVCFVLATLLGIFGFFGGFNGAAISVAQALAVIVFCCGTFLAGFSRRCHVFEKHKNDEPEPEYIADARRTTQRMAAMQARRQQKQ
jgi:hypothetical protein